MDREEFMNADVFYMLPVDSYEDLEPPPINTTGIAAAFHKTRSTSTKPYFFFCKNGVWDKESTLLYPEDLNVKIHVKDSWNSALDTLLATLKNQDKTVFLLEELESWANAMKIR